ncbi:GNAT family N-acetyltransferase [Gymnodinialimonas hymeniacidonis]|uniref:GNAT family N-acetyltransferase n=1 Tax=Gymnodinialimonas hymeniacidonis TaxID=3126508 RepID=UPI0034C5DC29
MTAHRCTQAPTGAAAKAATSHRDSIPVLETARLRLRAPTLDDLPAWTAIFAAPPFEADAEEAWTEFSYYTAGWMLHGHGLWAVELHDGTLVGFTHVGLEWGDDEPELGWMYLAEHHGQGYATEAAKAARDFGLSLLPTCVSYIDPDNAASSAVARRLGAERDATAESQIAETENVTIEVWRHGDAA